VSHIGRQKHYRANRSAPIFEELRSIVTKTVGLADPLRTALRPLAKRIDLALVYGSVASGSDRAQSDIDLLVVADGLTKLGRKIHPTLYTRGEFARRRRGGNAFEKKVLGGALHSADGKRSVPAGTAGYCGRGRPRSTSARNCG